MDELNELKRLNKSIISFTGSQFCSYVDIDSTFLYTSFSKFFFSLFTNDFNDEIKTCINEKSLREHVVDAYLSKVINLRSSLFLYLLNLSLKNDDKQSINHLESMNFDDNEIFFESCKKNHIFVVKHLI